MPVPFTLYPRAEDAGGGGANDWVAGAAVEGTHPSTGAVTRPQAELCGLLALFGLVIPPDDQPVAETIDAGLIGVIGRVGETAFRTCRPALRVEQTHVDLGVAVASVKPRDNKAIPKGRHAHFVRAIAAVGDLHRPVAARRHEESARHDDSVSEH